MTDLVSIIVPVYNVQKYLQRCVESLINQSYTNIEIILIDDGSSDDSLELCYKLAENDERLKVYKNDENIGQAATRQTGINLSAGKWIMFLDSDDAFTELAVEKMVCFAKESKADIVLSSYTTIINGERAIERANIENRVYGRQEFINKLLSDVKWNVLTCIGSKIYNKKFLEEKKISFSNEYKFNEDGAFILEALSYAERIGYLDEPFYQYFIRSSGSIQSSYREDMFYYINKVDVLLKDVFVKNDLFCGEIRTLWYKKHLGLYLYALANEANYRKFSEFNKVFKQIKSDYYYEQVIKCGKNDSAMMKIMVLSMKSNLPVILYAALKMHRLLKA